MSVDGDSRLVPWDQRIARVLVRPLVRAGLHPNYVTLATAVIALAGAAMFAPGDAALADGGAALFVASRFLDHFDGELARQSGRSSHLGYVLDYAAGGVSYFALFACMAIGLSRGALGGWAIALGALAALAALAAVWVNMSIDRARDGGTVGYPARGGFELEDGVYLLAPVTWLGWLVPFFVAACIGAGVYLAYSLLTLAGESRRRAGRRPGAFGRR